VQYVGAPTPLVLGYAATHWFDPAYDKIPRAPFYFLALTTQGCFCRSGHFGTHRKEYIIAQDGLMHQ
jgi:hypothetical protein